jgi:hypothetical protein
VPKFNANIKFKLNLGWLKYVGIRNLNKNRARQLKAPSHKICQTIPFWMHIVGKLYEKSCSF